MTNQIVIAADEAQVAPFAYDQLDSETRIVVQQKTGEIRERIETMQRSTVEIGQRLREVKGRLKHGQWGAWLASEFRWSDQTALNMINVAELAEQTPKILEFEDRFARSALTALAAPSTPPEARQAALALAESGEKVTSGMAQQLIAEHKPEQSKAAPLPTVPADLAAAGWTCRRYANTADRFVLVNDRHGGATPPLAAPEVFERARQIDAQLARPAAAQIAPAEEEIAASAAPAPAPAPAPALTPLPTAAPPTLTPLREAAGHATDEQALIQAAAVLLYPRKLVALAQRAWDQLAQPHLDRNVLPLVVIDEGQAEQAARLALASPFLRAQAGMLALGARLTMQVWDEESGEARPEGEEIAA